MLIQTKQPWLQSIRLIHRGKTGSLVDWIQVEVKGGKGGNGASAFDRSKMNPRGRPSGGDGGDGGSVILYGDRNMTNLNHIRFRLKADDGNSGGSNWRVGRRGSDLKVLVPPGTIVKRVFVNDLGNVENAENVENVDDIGDIKDIHGPNHCNPTTSNRDKPRSTRPTQWIITEDSETIIARGGRGGRGNFSFGNNNRDAEDGNCGEAGLFELEMVCVATVGLVGFPNAGKSSLLRAISNAKPKVAAYPFTTLTPNIGTVVSKQEGNSSFTVTDIPGLVEGAHLNIGLGHQFLKHIAKNKILACVLDLSRPHPIQDFMTLRGELEKYDPTMLDKLELIVANKIDLLGNQDKVNATLDLFISQLSPPIRVIPISAKYQTGTKALIDYLQTLAITKG